MKETEHLQRLVRTAEAPVGLWVHILKLLYWSSEHALLASSVPTAPSAMQ